MHLAYNTEIDARCPKCQGAAGVVTRKLFGCDEPASMPIFQRTCPECDGYGDGSCDLCGGTGYEVLARCPMSQSSTLGFVAVNAFQAWEVGILPSAGGSADQSAIFGDVIQIVKGERFKIQEALSEKN